MIRGLAVAALWPLVVVSPAEASVSHAVGALLRSYVPQSVTISEGDAVVFVNTDPTSGAGHSFTHDTPEGEPARFDTGVVPIGGVTEVDGVADLAPGEYRVKCTIHHPRTRGVLTVEGRR